MAVINSIVTQPQQSVTVKLASWAPLTFTTLDSGAPFQFVDWADRTFQVTGTFGAGGTIVLEGSNDGVNYNTLTDLNGNPMSYTAAAMKSITEAPLWVRPRVTAGDATTSLTVTVLARRLFPIF